jgi:Tfp pilus assembly protein PilO
VSILVVVALAVGFWMLVILPKQKEADQLGQEVQTLTSNVDVARSEVAAATAAKQSFPGDYRQLVVLGQAAPAGDETASLLVELEGIALSSGVEFRSIQLDSSSAEAAEAAPAPTAVPEAPSAEGSGAVQASATIPPTELAASLLPLGASIGPAGLYVMPYTLEFSGGFFPIAKFVRKVDALVEPGEEGIAVDGRLITIGSISLTSEGDEGSDLSASIKVTTFLSPPGEGVTAGATPTAPPPATAPEAATTVSTPESSATSSETVSAK